MANANANYNKALLIALREKVGLGSKTFQMLLSSFGSLEGIVDADIDSLIAMPRINSAKAKLIKNIDYELKGICADLELYTENGIKVWTIFDEDYPKALKYLSDPPFVLYTKGNFPLKDRPIIAIVGTTKASAESLELAVNYAIKLSAKGAVIVSGLARGIDTAAHLGAIKSEGSSYAVLGCGFDNIYPAENKALARELQEKGALISEYPPTTKVSTGRLISRNRIIVGLSQSVIVGEVDKKSRGSIDAAELAMDNGKLLFAIGDKFNPVDPGLIEFGAIPIDSYDMVDLVFDHSI